MRKVENLSEISDGRIYGLNDMVRVGSQDCKGCSDCCKGMGSSILLDPLDIYRITKNENLSMEQLLEDKVELNVVDGIILPNLRMTQEKQQCGFLNEEGRCSIHKSRPGICRIFPLGRCYDGHSFSYFLQVNECSKKNRTKEKVKRFIDTERLKENQEYILNWHEFLKAVEEMLLEKKDDAAHKRITIYILKQFFFTPYEFEQDFYEQFSQRLVQAKRILKLEV